MMATLGGIGFGRRSIDTLGVRPTSMLAGVPSLIRYKGVAPGVQFIICKVFDAKGEGDEGAVLAVVRWAIEHGADIINYSGGYAPIVHHQVLGTRLLVHGNSAKS